MKTGGRRLAERCRWRNKVVGSSSMDPDLSFLDRKIAMDTDITRKTHVNVKMEDKIATRCG